MLAATLAAALVLTSGAQSEREEPVDKETTMLEETLQDHATAIDAARKWIQLVDAGDYGDSWAQAPVEGVLALRRAHGLTSGEVDRIKVESFHEAIRLATARPRTTEEAQYSTCFPCAVALVRGGLEPADLDGDSLNDPEILRLSEGLVMTEDAHANAVFPGTRLARVRLHLRDGRVVQSDWMRPRWDAEAPPSEDDLAGKYRALAGPVLGSDRTRAIDEAISHLETGPLSTLTDLLYRAP